jgi:hypothetical protein
MTHFCILIRPPLEDLWRVGQVFELGRAEMR